MKPRENGEPSDDSIIGNDIQCIQEDITLPLLRKVTVSTPSGHFLVELYLKLSKSLIVN